jgi:uncharacterized membrane protein
LDSVTQLGSMLQVQMKTAGGSDEAANNLKNWMEKIGSGDTVEAYKKAGIDYQGSMNTGMQNGKSTLESSFALAQKYIEATDPKKAAEMAKATAAISKESDPEKAKAMIAALESALRTGDLFADMQVKGALTAYMQNKDLYDKLKKESASATGILDKNLAERRESSAQKQAEMVQGLDESMRAIGDAMRPVTDAVVGGITSVAGGLTKLADESPRLVTGIGLATAGLIGLSAAVSSFKMAKGLMNIGRGSLMGNPNIPQKVIVTNLPAGGGVGDGLDVDDVDAGDDKKGRKGKGSGKGGRGSGMGRGVGNVVKGAAVLAVADAGFKAYDTYQNAETQDEKAVGYGAAAGGLAGSLSGAAAGAALGTLILPVIGTAIGGLIGGVIGNMGGDALGGYVGKALFGANEATKKMPDAGPLMMTSAGKDIAPVMGDIAKSFTKPPGSAPLMMAPPGQSPAPAASAQIGDAGRSMMLPEASADAKAGPLAKPAPTATPPANIEARVDIQAPFSLTVQGDVQDANALYNRLKPMLDQHYRDLAKAQESRKLFDAPHV